MVNPQEKYSSETRNEHINFTYKDVNADIDETILIVESNSNRIVIDSSATKSVVGKLALEILKETFYGERRERMITRKDNRSFRFGKGVRYPSMYEVDMPFKLGSEERISQS